MSNRFYLEQLKQLIGAEVVGLVSDESNEFFGLQFRREGEKKPKVLWFQSDDEGNGPGSFSIEVQK